MEANEAQDSDQNFKKMASLSFKWITRIFQELDDLFVTLLLSINKGCFTKEVGFA